jgi:hypothetical protein
MSTNSKIKNKLSERAMLADLNIGSWTGRKKDSQVSDEVLANKGASKDSGAWWTYLIPPDSLAKINAAAGKGRTEHYRLTLPWFDSGPRVLPSALFNEYMETIRKCREAFENAVDDFLLVYPSLAANAPARLNDLHKNKPLPTVDELRHWLYWNVSILPMPEATDFRVELGDDIVKEIKSDIEEQSQRASSTALSDCWQRLYKVTSAIADKLNDPKGIFRDTLITNAIELCDLLPKLNVVGDPDLNRLREELLSKVATQDQAVLRKNKKVRADVAKQASDIADAMKAFMK